MNYEKSKKITVRKNYKYYKYYKKYKFKKTVRNVDSRHSEDTT